MFFLLVFLDFFDRYPFENENLEKLVSGAKRARPIR